MGVALVTHNIPLWFLVLSLFLPRLCIALAFLQHTMGQYIPSAVGLIPILVWLLVPRILILFWIYQDQGIGLWFLIHAIALLLAWGGGGTRVVRRRRVEVID
ncbi:hypothetical protein ACFQBQ_04735 [Granulicella cerasi]|uniref:Uncharacterized protein n=1 Tax=Granulicella cerasi TaxID=741063 RepID=A0ABW1Z640_9BACT|nr:hypothetical protein [Granulicella cerasi]